MEEAQITVRQLVKRWPNGRGVHGIDLRVRAGEVVGFLGPNGAGKTTTIRVLMGFARPGSGQAAVSARDCWRDQDWVRRHSGYVSGDVRLPAKLRVGEFLALLARLRRVAVGDALDLCDRLDLDATLPIGTLSKGNRQKVGLVAGLAHQAPALILDEPTSGLDPLLQQRFLDLILEARARGQAVLLSSHQLDEVQRVCDRVMIIREGVVVAEAPVDELRAQAPRRLTIYADQPAVPPAGLGVERAAIEGRRQEFLVKGNLSPVLSWLASLPIENLELAPANLQDLFLAYYTDSSRPAGPGGAA